MKDIGVCPKCHALGVARERQPNGHTICENRHKFLSSKWDEYNAASGNKVPPVEKAKGWWTPYGYIDFLQPTTYEDACRQMKEMVNRYNPKESTMK